MNSHGYVIMCVRGRLVKKMRRHVGKMSGGAGGGGRQPEMVCYLKTYVCIKAVHYG